MRDPHVAKLIYRLHPSERVSFEGAALLDYEDDILSLRLYQGQLTIKPKLHFPSVQQARVTIEPFLRSWELDVALRSGSRQIHFQYEDAELVDRNPPPPGSSQAILTASAQLAVVAETITIQVTMPDYPHPPALFSVSPDVETLWHRFEGYTQGREPLPSMAYFCLTLLEARGGSRTGATKLFKVSKDVLSKLGELTSQRGDDTVARKYPRSAPPAPLKPSEIAWIEQALRLLIRRVGEVAHLPALPEITLADLPEI